MQLHPRHRGSDAVEMDRAGRQVSARTHAPCSVIFDEIDRLLGGDAEHGEMLPTGEFQKRFEPRGLAKDRVILIGTTNFPDRLPDAVRARISDKLEMCQPPADNMAAHVLGLLKGVTHAISVEDMTELVDGSDLRALKQAVTFAQDQVKYGAAAELTVDVLAKQVTRLSGKQVCVSFARA